MTDEEIIRTLNEIRNGYLNLLMRLESAKSDPYIYYIKALEQSVKNVQAITNLKSEMKSMREKALNCENRDFATGYISAISTLEGYLSMLEIGGGVDGQTN
jgi:hypothetical protein